MCDGTDRLLRRGILELVEILEFAQFQRMEYFVTGSIS